MPCPEQQAHPFFIQALIICIKLWSRLARLGDFLLLEEDQCCNHGFCIPYRKWLYCRAVLVQLGFYFHMKQSLGYSRLVLTRPLLFTMCFMLFFSVVIALFKDIPDVRGDRQVSLQPLDTDVFYFWISRLTWLTMQMLIAPSNTSCLCKSQGHTVWKNL